MIVVKKSGSKKHHIQLGIVSDKTVCGRSGTLTEMISLDERPFDFCLKCWAYIGKQMVGKYLRYDVWEALKEYQSSVTKVSSDE